MIRELALQILFYWPLPSSAEEALSGAGLRSVGWLKPGPSDLPVKQLPGLSKTQLAFHRRRGPQPSVCLMRSQPLP